MKMKKLMISALAAACAIGAYAADPQFATVASPRVPRSMTFCGDNVNLDRTDMYERLDRELTSMAYTHGTTMLTLKRANRYFPIIAPILQERGVPADLIYLACIESSLDPTALSGAKAAGLWQFMPATAREYGLEVTDDVDERYDPVKSTHAAARFLRSLYNRFGNWEGAAAAYNAGAGRISGELDRQQQQSAYDLFLNRETSRYIFRMLAMKAIVENPRAYGYALTADDLYQPYEYTTVDVSEPVDDWPTWAAQHGSSYLELRDHNPWIRSRTLPNKSGKTYTVKLPTRESTSRSHQKKSVYNSKWIQQ